MTSSHSNTSFQNSTSLRMGQAAILNTHLTTGQVSDALTERISSLDGHIPTQRLFQHERWVVVRDIQRSMDIGAVGIGGRLSDSVSSYMVSGFIVCDR